MDLHRIRQNPRIAVHTLAEVKELSGEAGAFRACIRIKPRYVTGKVGLDDAVTEGLPADRSDDFNLGMSKTKALFLPHDRAYPSQYVLDRSALSEADTETLLEACPDGAIDLNMKEKEIHVDVGAIRMGQGTTENAYLQLLQEDQAHGFDR